MGCLRDSRRIALGYALPSSILKFDIGPGSAEVEEDSPVPSLIYEAYGMVLELGPGDGQQIGRLDPSKITKIYGIEPNLALHPELRTSIAKAGLENIYTIVPCGIEDRAELRKYGIESEGMDTILSIKVLCSVPEPERMTRELYRLLKPGGQLLLSEHVRSKNVLSRLIQGKFPNFCQHCWTDFGWQRCTISLGRICWHIATLLVRRMSIS